MTTRFDERNERIFLARWAGGRTLKDIGREFGLSGEQIRQIDARVYRKQIIGALRGQWQRAKDRKHYPGESPEEWVARVKRELAFEDACNDVIAAQEEVAAIRRMAPA